MRTYVLGLCLAGIPALAAASQVDIAGPPGSVLFGQRVTALPNGNFVVSDPAGGPAPNAGAVHLYDHRGALISSLKGSSANDWIGSAGIVVLANGNYVVASPCWHRDGVRIGAATWVDAQTGIEGEVSDANSLVGTFLPCSDFGFEAASNVTALGNGNYVVTAPYWSDDGIVARGAVAWADGSTGRAGPISAANALVGTSDNDQVGLGGVIELAGGDYVVASPQWNTAGAARVGAVTRGDGHAGIAGAVNVDNSLIGATADDHAGEGGVTPLRTGAYVVSTPGWHGDALAPVGAVTFARAHVGATGAITAQNSLVGNLAGDGDYENVVPLSNGNYVAVNPRWDNGPATEAGAVTWGSGENGISGPISAANSVVGVETYDFVGEGGVVALANGNYLIVSIAHGGRVTWRDGTAASTGTVTDANSFVGSYYAIALTNGNYVVSSDWSDGNLQYLGAVTWGNGSTGLFGQATAENSLVGSSEGDLVGRRMFALRNGNYVIDSPYWDHGSVTDAGAVTWANGSTGLVGVVSPANSLVGTQANDQVGSGQGGGLGLYPITLLDNGSYVVASPEWNNGALESAGAATWCDGTRSTAGAVSATNSLVGDVADARVGAWGANAYSRSHVIPDYLFGITLARSSMPLGGFITSENSVLSTAADGASLSFTYEEAYDLLIVGHPATNTVSLFQLDELFRGSFD